MITVTYDESKRSGVQNQIGNRYHRQTIETAEGWRVRHTDDKCTEETAQDLENEGTRTKGTACGLK